MGCNDYNIILQQQQSLKRKQGFRMNKNGDN